MESLRRDGVSVRPHGQADALTGCRREEIAAMRDSEIDLEARTFTLAPSQDQEQAKPYRPSKRRRPEHHQKDCDRVTNDAGYLFSTNGKTYATGYSKAKKQFDKLMATSRVAFP